MRRILGTIGAVAVVAAAGFGGAGLGDEAQVHRGTIDAVQAQSASAELEVSDDRATLEMFGNDRPGGETVASLITGDRLEGVHGFSG